MENKSEKPDDGRIIRRLKKEEQWKSDLVQAVCFEFPFNIEKARREAEQARTDMENEKERGEDTENKVPSDCWGCFESDNETLLANITVSRFRSKFDGHDILLGGVGGVSTMPQSRRSGMIRSCFEKALQDMYEKNITFSALYPFSTAYYRKFGYENNACVCEWTVPLEALSSENQPGSVEQLLPGDDLSPLLEVYRDFYREYNLAVHREVYDDSLKKDNLLEQKRYIYLWKNEDGKPQGFMICKKTEGDILDCTTGFALRNGFLAMNTQAYLGMFAFVRNSLSAYYKSIRFAVPENIHPDSFFLESTGICCRRYWNGMIRIINVEQALRFCRCKGRGSVCIEVRDEMLPQNRGIWKILFEQQQENQVRKTDEKPDIILPVGELSALLCGARSARELQWMPGVNIINADAPLDRIFYRKKCHILELF